MKKLKFEPSPEVCSAAIEIELAKNGTIAKVQFLGGGARAGHLHRDIARHDPDDAEGQRGDDQQHRQGRDDPPCRISQHARVSPA